MFTEMSEKFYSWLKIAQNLTQGKVVTVHWCFCLEWVQFTCINLELNIPLLTKLPFRLRALPESSNQDILDVLGESPESQKMNFTVFCILCGKYI